MRMSDWSSDVCSSDRDSKSTLYCSFYGKSQHEVRKLIAGPTVFICDECVELCNEIIREETKSALVSKKDGGVPTAQEICDVLEIGREAFRERVCQKVKISGVAGTHKKTKTAEK